MNGAGGTVDGFVDPRENLPEDLDVRFFILPKRSFLIFIAGIRDLWTTWYTSLHPLGITIYPHKINGTLCRSRTATSA